MVKVYRVKRESGYVLTKVNGQRLFDKLFILDNQGTLFDVNKHKLERITDLSKVTERNLQGDIRVMLGKEVPEAVVLDKAQLIAKIIEAGGKIDKSLSEEELAEQLRELTKADKSLIDPDKMNKEELQDALKAYGMTEDKPEAVLRMRLKEVLAK